MNGDVKGSYAKGNAVHEAFARVVAVHAVKYMLIEENVGWRVKSHNIFLEDGIETNIVIKNNLMISSLTHFGMLQTDITAASYW